MRIMKNNNNKMMIRIQSILYFFLLLLLLMSSSRMTMTNGYPNGTGTCIGGQSAVLNTPHMNPIIHLNPIVNVTLEQANVQVEFIPQLSSQSSSSINSTTILKKNHTLEPIVTIVNTTTTKVPLLVHAVLYTNTEYLLEIRGVKQKYKGCFVRFEAKRSSSSGTTSTTTTSNSSTISSSSGNAAALLDEWFTMLLPNVNTQRADYVCDAVQSQLQEEQEGDDTIIMGITHYNGTSFKEKHSGIVYVPEPGYIIMDVTVVGVNNASDSLSAYEQYMIQFIDLTSTTTITPVTTIPVSTSPTTTTTTTTISPTVLAYTSTPSTTTTVPEESPATGTSPVSVPITAPVPTIPVLDFSDNNNNANNQNNSTSSSMISLDIDITKYTTYINEEIRYIQLSYMNVPLLSLSNLRNLEAITEEWFLQFYNERSSTSTTNSTNTTTNNNNTKENNDENRFRHRRIQQVEQDKDNKNRLLLQVLQRQIQEDVSLSQSPPPPPPQAYVVQGSMETYISIMNQNISYITAPVSASPTTTNNTNATTASSSSSSSTIPVNTITFRQQVSYRLYNMDAPYLPSNMKTKTLYQPLSPIQYTILPYRSVSTNKYYVQLLRWYLPESFGNLIVPTTTSSSSTPTTNTTNVTATTTTTGMLPIPKLVSSETMYGIAMEPSSSSSNNNNKNDTIRPGAVAGIVVGTIGIIIVLITLFVLIYMNRHSSKKNNTTTNQQQKQNVVVVTPDNNGFLSDEEIDLYNNQNNNTINNTTTNNNKYVGNRSRSSSKSENEPNSFDASSQFTNPKVQKQKQQQTPTRTAIAAAAADMAAGGGGGGGGGGNHNTATTIFNKKSNKNKNHGGTNDEHSDSHKDQQDHDEDDDDDETYVVYAPSGKLGIVVDNPDDDSGPIIYAIKETSPLLDSTLHVGDRLVMVDEINVTKMAPALISKLISRRAGNPMRKLTLQRTNSQQDERLVF